MKLFQLVFLLGIVIVSPSRADAAAEDDMGAAVYRNLCAACHGDDGLGVPGTYPPLAGSTYLNGDPSSSIRIVLHGLEGPVTVGGETFNSVMPPNAETLTDEEIAAVLNHARGRWGETGGTPITGRVVAEIRAEDPERVKMWTVAELSALAVPPPGPVVAAGSSPGSTGNQPGITSVPASRSSAPLPLLLLLSLPLVVFLAGICLVGGNRE